MSQRKRSNSRRPHDTLSTDKIELIFSKDHAFQTTKSQILLNNNDGKTLTKFIEDKLHHINVFNYPYEMFYCADVKGVKKICYSIRSDECNQEIGDLLKELIKSDEGKKIDKIYFSA